MTLYAIAVGLLYAVAVVFGLYAVAPSNQIHRTPDQTMGAIVIAAVCAGCAAGIQAA